MGKIYTTMSTLTIEVMEATKAPKFDHDKTVHRELMSRS